MNTPVWTISVGGTDRKYKHIDLDRKVRMDSPPEFTAVIEYGDDVDFNDVVIIQRDGKTEWKGFIEDMEIDWDENGRYLNVGGRDITLLIWRKYVENFTNMIQGTGGFFGNVSASELMKFLLRTPRSDLPTSVEGNSIYPYNKEGWGIDVSRFNGLDAQRTAYGDINWAILRKRGLGWRNSGDPYAVAPDKAVDGLISCAWETNGTTPYINVNDGGSSWIHSHIGVNDTAEFSFADMNGEGASSIYGCKLSIHWKPDGTYWTWIQSDCWVYIWVQSQNQWVYIGDFGGKGNVFGEPWRVTDFDLFYILNTIADINAAKVRFVEKSGSLSTNITYAALEIGYVGHGEMNTDDWVQLSFDDETIMGIYVESRNSQEMYPRDYKITCVGNVEDFSDYSEVDPNSHISLAGDEQTLTFNSYQSETAYFYKDYGAGTPLGDFDETFSFEVDTSQPHPYAYIPWCLANNLEDYKTLINTAGHYFTAIEVNDTDGSLTVRATLRDSGGLGHTASYDIDHSVRYFVKVTRVGTTLRYQFFNNSAMRTEDLVFDETFSGTDGTTFRYRYQAITYNGLEWAEVFLDTMDHSGSGGEQIINGTFETGNMTGWSGGTATVVTTDPHSGTYCCKLSPWAGLIQTVNVNIAKGDVSQASFWYKAPAGSTFDFILNYTDYDYTEWTIYGTGAWTEVDILSHWTDGKNLLNIHFGLNSAEMYIDDVSVYEDTIWSRAGGTGGGTATRSTDTVNQIQGTGCQKIHGNANAQGYYFEEDLTTTDLIKVDGYVRVPAPTSEAVNHDLECTTFSVYGSNYHWGLVGTPPYVNNEGSMDTNHVWVAGTIPTPAEIDDYFSFQQIDTVTGKTHGSFAPNSNSKLHIEARIYNTGGGNCTNTTLRLYIWVQHENGGAGQWHDVTDIGFGATGNAWGTIYDSDVSAILLTKTDWDNAKVRFDIESVTGTDLGESEIQVGYIRFHAEGTGYMGTVRLMKVYNNAIAGGPNPSTGWIGGVLCQLDPDSLTDMDKFRFACDGFSGSGTWNTAATTSEAVVPDTWYKLRLYAYKASSGGYFKLYKVVALVETLLCQVTGLDNHNYGSMDRYEFEVEYGTFNGNGQDAYLDWTKVETQGSTYSTGIVYSGYGPDITLVNVTNNTYKDIIHSWQPRNMNNLKISITEDDAVHGWEITQIYLYKTDPLKYRVVSDGLSETDIKLTFASGGYTPCVDEDIGRQVHTTALGDIGALVSFDNDLREWRVSSVESLTSGTGVTITSGTGAGTLSVDSTSSYSGGPYITIGAELDPSFEYSVPLEPMNIPKNRLFDVFWDLCVAINDEYMPYEWWVDYDADNTFHIGSRRGYDKSATVSFTTGVNMQGVKFQKSSRDCYQRCQVIGSGEGNTQDNSSSFWESDEDAMDIVHGFIEDIVTQKQISNPRLANRYAKVKLKLDASPTRKNAIGCIISKDTYASFDYTDPSDTATYNVGDDVTITDIFTDLSASLRIYNIKVVIDDNGEHPTLTVQAPYLDIKNIWKQIWKELKNLGIVGTIAQDWAGEGTQSSKVSAEKLSTLFSVTAKNEEVNTEPSTSPKWWETPAPANGADWNAADSNLVIYGGTGGIGDMEVEARYEPITGSPDSGTPILVAVDIAMSQEPNFTGEFKIWEPASGSPWSQWLDNDYVEFGIYNTDTDNGFKFRVKKESGQFLIYAVYTINGVEQDVKKICSLSPSTSITDSHKYKVEIITDYSTPITSVTFNVYDEAAGGTDPISAAFIKIQNVSVRPIYVHAHGDGTSLNKRCIMHFYDLKCERKVMP